jgi:hypothetical protein
VEPTTPANTAAPSATATPDRSPPAATGASGRVAVSIRPVSPADGTFAVDLAKPPLIDWVAVGARADLKQVRAKAQIAKPLLTVEQPGTATSAPGPFSTSWSAGLPEQSHDGATDWLMAQAQPGLTVILARSSESRTVKLFAGTRDVRGTLVVTGPGLARKRMALGPASSQARGLVVTVVLPPTTGPTRLQLTGSPDGPAPRVYLAAATVTTR